MRKQSSTKAALIRPPKWLLGHKNDINAGWAAFFDGRNSSDNPYLPGSTDHEAWKWGFFEAMDYGS